ncbi:O-antigen translocase [Mesorhizobium sp. NPDC059054]|uniref:O-antigen translocase n=1 Tax=Mesorhizobium sp. NPDC059054 TaxID=3346711 RepID=UPI0036797019
MEKAKSYRAILRASAIMGIASILHILFGMLRIKIAAVLLGPAGVGLIGLLQNLMNTGSIMAGLGMDTIGTRNIAAATAEGSLTEVDRTRSLLFWGLAAMGIVGGVLFAVLRQPLSELILGDRRWENEVGCVAFGLALSVAATGQVALLNGLRQIPFLALLKVATSILATCLGTVALLIWGNAGMVLFVISLPLANFAVGFVLTSRIPKRHAAPIPTPQLLRGVLNLARLGTPLMIGGIATLIGQLMVRGIVQQQLGIEALGLFEASWMISMTYIGFVLSAMATDYFPRLSGTIRDHSAATQLVNDQTEVALILVGPILLLLMGLAPTVISLLYTAEFGQAAEILRWQILGDLLKVLSWPLAFVLLASGLNRAFLLAEAGAAIVFVGVVWIDLPLLGPIGTGVGFLALYLFYLPTVFLIARHSIGFAWTRQVHTRFVLLAVAAIGIFALSAEFEVAGAVLGTLLAMCFGLQGLYQLRKTARLEHEVP